LRLDNDVRFLPFATLIWLIILGNKYLSFTSVLTFVVISMSIFFLSYSNKLFSTSLILVAILAMTISYFRSDDFNLQSLNLNEKFELTGEIRSDLIPTNPPKFGTLEMFSKYYFKFKIDNLKQENINVENISHLIKVNVSNSEDLEFGTKIKLHGHLNSSNFLNFRYEITPEKIIIYINLIS